jgi:hypothetical protein
MVARVVPGVVDPPRTTLPGQRPDHPSPQRRHPARTSGQLGPDTRDVDRAVRAPEGPGVEHSDQSDLERVSRSPTHALTNSSTRTLVSTPSTVRTRPTRAPGPRPGLTLRASACCDPLVRKVISSCMRRAPMGRRWSRGALDGGRGHPRDAAEFGAGGRRLISAGSRAAETVHGQRPGWQPAAPLLANGSPSAPRGPAGPL